MSFLALTGVELVEVGSFLEGTMIFIFGISWPFAIYRTWKAKKVEGKSLVFLVLVFVGYCIGVVSKFARYAGGTVLEKNTIFYAINAVLVGIDLCLYLYYRRRNTALAAASPGTPINPPVE